jgi:SAM-dependent methyltransferase
MSTHERETFLQTYDWVTDWQQLPWAHDEPTLFLAEICARRRPGTALDIGCGAGTDSVYLARQGWDVTSLDFMPKALEFTQQRAREAGVGITPVEADITAWNPPGQFDLVLDHGLLHNMDPVRHAAYRERVMNAIAADGDFVLLHWHPLYPGQPDGKMGPRRVGREAIVDFFAPELQERYFAAEEFEDLPDFVGRGMRQAYYWFRRNPADASPAELLGQIEATLRRHDVDDAAAAAADGAPVDAELLAMIVGPGRLGLAPRTPEVAKIGEIVAKFAEKAQKPPVYVEKLLCVFSSEAHGGICVRNARCTECGVGFCKRQRYR